MSKIKIEVTCDNITSTVEIDSEVWMDSFPSYLNALRGAGYCIPEGTSIYVPGELFEKCENEYGYKRDFVLTDSDIKSEEDFDDNWSEEALGEAVGDLIREELNKYVDEREALQKDVDRLSAAMNADTTWKPIFGHTPAGLDQDDVVEIACRGEFYIRHARNVAWSTVAELDGRWRLIRKADEWIQVEFRSGRVDVPILQDDDLVEVKFADGKVTTLRFGYIGSKWNLINEYRVKART